MKEYFFVLKKIDWDFTEVTLDKIKLKWFNLKFINIFHDNIHHKIEKSDDGEYKK